MYSMLVRLAENYVAGSIIIEIVWSTCMFTITLVQTNIVKTMCTMSIESSPTSMTLEREDYWCRELCTYYPYGLYDNVKGVGNIPKMKAELLTLFNRERRKFKARKHCRH